VTISSVNTVAHRIGNMAFLLPDGIIVPESGLPPLTSKLAIATLSGKTQVKERYI
jgi:hypothetical protein